MQSAEKGLLRTSSPSLRLEDILSICLLLKETTLFDKLLCYTEGSAIFLRKRDKISWDTSGTAVVEHFCLKTNSKYTEGEGREEQRDGL